MKIPKPLNEVLIIKILAGTLAVIVYLTVIYGLKAKETPTIIRIPAPKIQAKLDEISREVAKLKPRTIIKTCIVRQYIARKQPVVIMKYLPAKAIAIAKPPMAAPPILKTVIAAPSKAIVKNSPANDLHTVLRHMMKLDGTQ